MSIYPPVPVTERPLSEPGNINNPYPFYSWVRSESPVYKTTLSNGVEVYLVTRYADVLAGLKDPRLVKDIRNARPQSENNQGVAGSSTNPKNDSMLRADPPEHTRLRAIAHAAFTPRVVNQMRVHIQDIADRLLDVVQPQGKMDLINDFAFPLPITVITEMLGVPIADEDKFRRWSTAIIHSGVLNNETVQMVPEMLPMAQYMGQLVGERRKAPKDDLISHLISAEDNGDHFSEQEVVGTAILLLIAGHETTVNLIGNGMLALLQQPEQMEQLKQNPALIKPAVEEILRFVNPVQAVNRYASVDMEIGGVSIPRGSHLWLVVAAADHDPVFTGTPDQLDVTHGDAKHLAFGQGIHYCLGAPLARLEGEIAFTRLLTRLPNIRLADPHASLSWRPGFELRGLSSLPVSF